MNEKYEVLNETTRLKEKLENSAAGQLEKKVKMLSEERNEMKSDFYIKINSFVEEISELKQKLLKYEDIDEDEYKDKSNISSI